MSEAKGTKSYPIQALITFGEQLLKTGDLDPVYIALVKAELPRDQVYRLLLAYFCFYHLGVSAYISELEGETFWQVMEIAARNSLCWPDEINPDLPGGRWPRGSERRHFRGPRCVEAVLELRGDLSDPYPPEYHVKTLAYASIDQDLATVMGWVQQKPLFGPWISFKVADVLERVFGVSIKFPEDLTLMYKEPRAALDMLTVPAIEANDQLLSHFRRFKAPPRQDRQCNIQEIETMCCKFKSAMGGHYWVGKDIHEIRKGLRGWGKTADQLLKAMPFEVVREGQLHA